MLIYFKEWCAALSLSKKASRGLCMAREIFDYSKSNPNDYEYFGFHLKDGRYHIDTKRLKKLHIDYCFPKELFTLPRNTHYFTPSHKNINDWGINILLNQLNKLSNDWNEEYRYVINEIKTPEQVEENVRIDEMMMTSCSDDYDQIQEDAFFAGIHRLAKYEEVIKSIHLQYLQKIFTEYFRALLLTIKDRGYENKEDFTFEKLCGYVQARFNVENKRANPLFKLPHYRYLDILNKIDNFLKHNTVRSYNALANNPFEKDEELKAFQSTFVLSNDEAGIEYENGMYAGDWLKIGPEFVNETLENLREFSKEFCKLMYDEDSHEAWWNSDEHLINLLRNEVIHPSW